MATRYTYKTLCADIAEMNEKLDAAGSTRFLEAGHRYNYSALDELTREQYEFRQGRRADHSGCVRNLEAGSPRECYAAANAFFWQQMALAEKE